MTKLRKSQTMLDRRQLMKQLALGGAAGAFALEQLAGVPLLGTWASDWLANPMNKYDAYAMMGDALRGGPAILGVHKAMADAAVGWTLVQIKVCNHVYTPLVFRLGEASADGATVTVDSDVVQASGMASVAKTMLEAAGVNAISDKPRYRALRFNKWFADMLHNGTADGKAAAGPNRLGLGESDIAPFSDAVAIQTFLGVGQNADNNHSLKGTRLRPAMADLTLFAQKSGLIESPLGISCFMMGDTYDMAEGATPTNAVLGESVADVEDVVVKSRSVRAYVSQVKQYVGKSYADRAPIEQNVIYRLDHLVQEDPVLRRDLVNSIVQFQQGLGGLGASAELESNRQTIVAANANTQSDGKARGTGNEQGATTEFLAQCKYVTASLELPGVPVRNFSLFLNVCDLDQGKYDVADNGGGNVGPKPYSYVEGMRQLAMGLNVLAKKIAAGSKMIVVVHSEGGRLNTMADGKTSFSMVMAPRGAGMLDDALYASMASINKKRGTGVNEPGARSAAVAWDTPGLMKKDGTASTLAPTSGDIQMGVIEFLEEQTGKSARAALSAADGGFVKLKRKA